MSGELKKIEQDIIDLWTNFRAEPKRAEMPLGNYRKFFATRSDLAQHAIDFLEQTKNVADDAIVVLTPGHISLLTDAEGNLLAFR